MVIRALFNYFEIFKKNVLFITTIFEHFGWKKFKFIFKLQDTSDYPWTCVAREPRMSNSTDNLRYDQNKAYTQIRSYIQTNLFFTNKIRPTSCNWD